MTELSPAAQAVLDAADEVFAHGGRIRDGFAASLRAAADQMSYAGADEAATWLVQIAVELEGQ